MPYIKQTDRELINPLLDDFLRSVDVLTVGDLNYTITSILHQWLKDQNLCYKNINAAIGVLECVKLELYRMIAAPYEDNKKFLNGAISDLDNTDARTPNG